MLLGKFAICRLAIAIALRVLHCSASSFIVYMIMLLNTFCTDEGSTNVAAIIVPIVIILALIVAIMVVVFVLIILKFCFHGHKEDYHVCEGEIIMQSFSTV